MFNNLCDINNLFQLGYYPFQIPLYPKVSIFTNHPKQIQIRNKIKILVSYLHS